MNAAQLNAFIAKLKSEPSLQNQLTQEDINIVSTAKVAAAFIELKDSSLESNSELNDEVILDKISEALSKRSAPQVNPIIIWASILVALLVAIGVFLNINY